MVAASKRLVRDHLQGRQHHQHGEGEPLPGLGEGDGPQGRRGIGDQGGDRVAQELEQAVEGAHVGRVDHLPDHGDDDGRQDHGHQECRADRLEEGRARVQQQGYAQAHQELHGNTRHRQAELGADRAQEALVDGEILVVREWIGEVERRARAREVERCQARDQEVESRRHGDRGQHDQRRQEPGQERLLAGALPAAGISGCRCEHRHVRPARRPASGRRSSLPGPWPSPPWPRAGPRR